jgi:hypothetical protein
LTESISASQWAVSTNADQIRNVLLQQVRGCLKKCLKRLFKYMCEELTVNLPSRSRKSLHRAEPIIVPPRWIMSETVFQSASLILSPPSIIPWYPS